MSFVMLYINPKSWTQRLCHKLFHCPTFWRLRASFKCPKCGRNYRCYWDGNDILGYGIDICERCAELIINMEELKK